MPSLHQLRILAAVLVLGACGQGHLSLSDPRPFEPYVSAYSGPVIGRSSPLIVTFTAPYGRNMEPGETSRLLTMEPGIKGTASWTDDHTLSFSPESWLPSGQDYLVSLHLDRLVQGLPDSLREFRFNVQVKKQFLGIRTEEPLIPDQDHPDVFRVEGQALTQDLAEAEKVEQCLTFKGSLGKPVISWSHDPDGTTHRFTIDGLSREAEDADLILDWSGRPLGIPDAGSRTITIPGSAQFKVTGFQVEQSGQSAIKLNFSRLLLPDQDLTGLIRLRESPDMIPRFLIHRNTVTCYFPDRLVGDQTLDVDRSIRDFQEQKLDLAFTAVAAFTQAAPNVRGVGTGMIMPTSSELLFPFEAVNLQAVDLEIFKIHTSNILQFLQVNNLEGNYELQRVGKIIHRSRVDLSLLNPEGNATEWVRYALDLAPLIDRDPGAIYQVRIGFWPDDTNYACDSRGTSDEESATDAVNTEDMEDMEDSPEETDREGSIMEAWWGPYGWNSSYSWEHRDDPCYPEYYNSDRFLSRNVLASDLGLIVKMNDNGDVLALVTDLRTAEPVGRAALTFYDEQLQPVQSGQTSGDGWYRGHIPSRPTFAIARTKTTSGYLVLRKGENLTVSDFETSGVAVSRGLRGFPYAERGVWRPGDSIYLNLILHDPDQSIPPAYPVTMEIFDPRGRPVYKTVNASPVGDVYAFPFRTSADAPTGAWHARFQAGGSTFHHYLRVEAIKPNRLKLKLDLDQTRPGLDVEPLSGSLTAQWLHGSPAAGQAVRIEARVHDNRQPFRGYSDYQFAHPDRDGRDPSPFVWASGRTDALGVFRISGQPLLQDLQPPGRLRVDLKFRVDEPGGGFSQDFRSIDYDPYTAYCGLKLPQNEYGIPSFDPGQKARVSVVCLDPLGKPLPGRTLEIRQTRLEWKWWWERDRDNRMNYASQEARETRKEGRITTNAKGLGEWTPDLEEFGRYQIEVCDPVSGHCTAADIYVIDRQNQSVNDSRYFAFSTDRESYKPGDRIEVRLPGALSGKALVSVETGSAILETKLISLQPDHTTCTLQATRDMVPNAYIHVSLIQPHAAGTSDLPMRLYSICPVSVEDPDTRLEPVVNAPKDMRPDQAYPFTVREAKGREMTYTLALVDEGLLDLTHFQTPDPHAGLYSKEALGISTWDLYDDVLGGFSGELRRIVAIGGDGSAAAPDGSPKANRFKPAVVHLGPFHLKPGKTATHRITVNNYVGRVRMMVVAAGQEAYGHTEASIPVRKPLMAVATLPRQLGLGERLELPVTVFAMEPGIRKVDVTVTESSGLVRWEGSSQGRLTFPETGEKTLYLPISTGNGSGVAKFHIVARSGGETATQDVEIAIRNPNPLQTLTQTALLKPGESHTFEATLAGTPGTNSVLLEAFQLPPVDLTRHLNTLLNYPFGCLEQTTSKALPLLVLSALEDQTANRTKEIRFQVNAAIRRIMSQTDGTGRIAYWPGGGYRHEWSETWAAIFLSMAAREGYSLPESEWRSILNAQKTLANHWTADRTTLKAYGIYSTTQQAFRLYMLALAGEPQMGAMNRFKDVPDLAELDRWLLAGAFARSGKPEVSRKLVPGSAQSVPVYRDDRYAFGSDVRDQGLMVLALLDMQDKSRAFPILRNLAGRLQGDTWYATHSVAVGLWAYAAYARAAQTGSTITLDIQPAQGEPKTIGTNKSVIRHSLSPVAVDRKPLKVKNTSKADVYVQLSLTGRPAAGREVPGNHGIGLEIRYVDANGKPMDVDRLAQGTDFFAIADVTNLTLTGDRIAEVAFSHLIPSGWEIRNLRMDPTIQWPWAQSPLKYEDLRDDRADAFFDLPGWASNGQRKATTIVIPLTASYPGRYYLPARKAEAMYNADLSALQPGKWVDVTGDDGSTPVE